MFEKEGLKTTSACYFWNDKYTTILLYIGWKKSRVFEINVIVILEENKNCHFIKGSYAYFI